MVSRWILMTLMISCPAVLLYHTGIFSFPVISLFPSSAVVKPTWMYNLIILISTLVFFLIPMLAISVLYLLIGLQLHRERVMTMVDTRCSFGPESLSASHKEKLSKRNLQVTKMLCRCHFSPVFSELLRSRKPSLNWLCICVTWISYNLRQGGCVFTYAGLFVSLSVKMITQKKQLTYLFETPGIFLNDSLTLRERAKIKFASFSVHSLDNG